MKKALLTAMIFLSCDSDQTKMNRYLLYKDEHARLVERSERRIKTYNSFKYRWDPDSNDIRTAKEMIRYWNEEMAASAFTLDSLRLVAFP